MRHALRQLARSPSFTAVAVLTLALGIGTNTAIFAIVDELAFKPARSTDGDDVYYLGTVQIADYDILAANQPDGVAAIATLDDNYSGLLQIPGRAERVIPARVSGSYATVHRVGVQIGRWINDDDNAGGELDPAIDSRGVKRPIVLGRLGSPVAVISDRIWRDWFHASPDVVQNGSITLNHQAVRIIGVAPRGFKPDIDLWTPFGSRRLLTRAELEARRVTKPPPGWKGPLPEPLQPTLRVILRKDPGVAASVVIDRLTAAVASRPVTLDAPATRMRLVQWRGNDRNVTTGYTILGFAALIFIAACANLGNMLFARATEREGELAVRLSLGATRLGVFALLFSEAVTICAAASFVGLAFAIGALQLFTEAFPAFQVNSWKRVTLDLSLDWRIAAYSIGAGAIAAAIVGAGSLWRSSRVSLLARLAASSTSVVAKTEGRTLRTMLVSVQVTAAVLLLIATGMLLENTSKRLNRRLHFDTTSLISAQLDLPDTYDESRGAHFWEQLVTRVRAIDGVSDASLTDALPGGEFPSPRQGSSAILAEAPERGLSGVPRRLDGQWIHVGSRFAGTIGVTLTKGRDFRTTDIAGSDPVAIVSESVAQALWPREDPIGKRFACCGAAYERSVVGVVADPTGTVDRAASLNIGEAMAELSAASRGSRLVMLPQAQHYNSTMLIVARTDSPEATVEQLRQAVIALDPQIPVFGAGPVEATQFAGAAAETSVRVLAGSLGAIALGIAVFGVYAIVSYFVTLRRREFGLRLAMGSTRTQIVRLVVDYAIHIVLIGLLPGVLLASLATRYFQKELQGLHPNGLTVWIAVPILMLVAGIIAAYIPARRASKIDPYRALREL